MAEHVCPVWVGYLLANPLRKLFQDPARILAPYVEPGMTVVEVGPGMGFFSIPMAGMVGRNGRVVCVDLQEGMLKRLQRRAAKAGVGGQIQSRPCSADSLGIQDVVADFILLFYVAHEVPDQPNLFAQLATILKPGGIVLFTEPRGHVKEDEFARSISIAEQHGLTVVGSPEIRRSLVALLRKS